MFIDHYKTLININKHTDAIKYSGVMFHLIYSLVNEQLVATVFKC